MGSPARGFFLNCRSKRFNLAIRPLLMGIINLTTDSFSDGGRYRTPLSAYQRAKAMIDAGADIIDVGAESTRPGAIPISAPEELRRILPVLKRIVNLGVPVSVDTYKPEVARKVIAAGAQMINDVTGLQDPEMRQVVARAKVPIVIMHIQGTPQTMQKAPRYDDVVQDVRKALLRRVRQARVAGIADSKIILDPGIGFGKNLQHNLLLLNNIQDLIKTGYPVLIGVSRKSFISGILGTLPPQERVWGTSAAVALAVARGAHILRVHDVSEMKMTIQVAHAIRDAGKRQKQEKATRRQVAHAA
ncbi:dihydropteroate synthase [bacterium]|nr:dihydropteroate synthase [bacterium]